MPIVRKVKNKIEHLLIASYAVLHHARIIRYTASNKVMLFFSAHIGDVVIFLDTLQKYKELYSQKNGYQLVFACRKEVWAFLEQLGYTDGMEFIDVNRDVIYNSFSEFKKSVKSANKYQYKYFISPRTVSIVEIVFEYCLCAEKKYVVAVENDESRRSKKYQYFLKRLNDDVLQVAKDVMILKRFSLLYDKVANVNSQVMVSRINIPDIKMPLPELYIVIAPSTAETPSKCWEINLYIKLIDELIDQFNINVILSGGKNDRPICEFILSGIKNKSKVYNLAGTTSFKEWIVLIGNAKMVVCNDSSPMHIAASTGRPCVCIGGQWEGSCYYPYVVDKMREDDVLPEVVLGDKLPCHYCMLTKDGRQGNAECKVAIKEARSYPCIENVLYDDVAKCVIDILGEK